MPEIIVKLGDSIVQKNIFVKETIRIGRVPDNEIVIENLAISRYHSVIEYEDGRYILSDLDSSNGTFVNGVRIKRTELQDRDVVTIGKHKLYFYDQRAAAEAKPRPPVIDIERTMLVEQPASPAPMAQAELEVVKGRQKGARFVINGAQTSIGRASFNEIQLSDWFISKVHAVIERRGSEFVIRDLGSWRHTYVNNILVHEMPLAEGDTIQMGPSVQLTFTLVRKEQALPSAGRVPMELAAGADAPARRGERETSENTERQITPRPAPVAAQNGPMPGSILAASGASVMPLMPPMRMDPLQEFREEPEPDEGRDEYRGEEGGVEGGVEGDEDRLEFDDEFEAIPPAPETAAPAEAAEAFEPIGLAGLAEPVDEEEAEAQDEIETPDDAEGPAVTFEFPWAHKGLNGHGEAPQSAPEPPVDEETAREIEMWERALKNKNPIIRKQAARQLQKLTGRDYDYT